MRALKERTNKLKEKLSTMYEELAGAMDTEAGHEAQLEAKNVLLTPIENMSLVVNHISDTLDTVIGNGYYKDVFTGGMTTTMKCFVAGTLVLTASGLVAIENIKPGDMVCLLYTSFLVKK